MKNILRSRSFSFLSVSLFSQGASFEWAVSHGPDTATAGATSRISFIRADTMLFRIN